MDPINERHMLRMLMETESSENASQYFFVTPKVSSLLVWMYCMCTHVCMHIVIIIAVADRNVKVTWIQMIRRPVGRHVNCILHY